MNRFLIWLADERNLIFFAVICLPGIVASTYLVVDWMRAWNKSIARRRLVFLLKFALWLIAMALKKLSEKGFAQNVDTIVTSLIPKEEVQAYASEHFVEHTFQGSLPGFLVSFLGGKTISADEAAELKRLIDEHKE